MSVQVQMPLIIAQICEDLQLPSASATSVPAPEDSAPPPSVSNRYVCPYMKVLITTTILVLGEESMKPGKLWLDAPTPDSSAVWESCASLGQLASYMLCS